MVEAAPDPSIDLKWLITLRWAAIAGQLLMIVAVVFALDVALPWAPLLAIIAVEAATNIVAQLRLSGSESPERVAGALLTVDVLALTGLLYFSGGPHNPFNFLYLVYIALGAVVLRPSATWALAGLSAAAFGALFFDSVSLDALGGHGRHDMGAMDHGAMDHGAMGHSAMGHESMDHSAMEATQPAVDPMDLHLRGMWVAFTIGAAFIVYFVTRVKTALAERDLALASIRERAVVSERLASLATLAGGAAHELATPLGTIAIIAKELQLELEEQEAGTAVEDIILIRSQVDRCRGVLNQLAVDAGEAPGESRDEIGLDDLITGVVEGLNRRKRVTVEVPSALVACQIPGYRSAMAQTLGGVLRNALDASNDDQSVTVTASRGDGGVLITVHDEGTGMDAATLTRATEPFFTTKPEGSGMGLGLFLGRTVLERQGGSLTLESTPGVGTTVRMLFPCEKMP
ncbi:MAG: sensor histidine kinase [Deltaproteobacteria bacterium]|nr:sensor histidine kinase [Deltaproteobacteria bacterium]